MIWLSFVMIKYATSIRIWNINMLIQQLYGIKYMIVMISIFFTMHTNLRYVKGLRCGALLHAVGCTNTMTYDAPGIDNIITVSPSVLMVITPIIV